MKHKIAINKDYGGFCLSNKAVQWLKQHGACLDENFKRHDPLLIKCIETLGKEVNTDYSNIGIVEIDGNQYRICEYDGAEWVETPDSIEWVTIKEPQINIE